MAEATSVPSIAAEAMGFLALRRGDTEASTNWFDLRPEAQRPKKPRRRNDEAFVVTKKVSYRGFTFAA